MINQSLRSQENVPDSIKAELNYYNYLARGESREESLLKAIDLYEKLNNVDSRRLSQLYRTFLTNPYNGDKKNVMTLLSNFSKIDIFMHPILNI